MALRNFTCESVPKHSHILLISGDIMISDYYEKLIYNLVKPAFEKKYGKGIMRKQTLTGTVRVEGELYSYKKVEEYLQPLDEVIMMFLVFELYRLIDYDSYY